MMIPLSRGQERCFIIGEVAQAHEGSLGMAHAYIDLLREVGADAVKFQTHIASAESSPDEPWRVAFSRQDRTRYDYWRRMEFTPEQWAGLKQHAEDVGLVFMSSAFSNEAVELLASLGIEIWKVASGELTNFPLLAAMARHGRRIILSTGMSSYAEIGASVSFLRTLGADISLMQCTSAYPCPPEDAGLNVINELRRRFDCPVGWSDHSGQPFLPLAAVVRGATMVEAHITFDHRMFGPDVPASLVPDDFRRMVDGIRTVEAALASPVDKDFVAQRMGSMREAFMRGITTERDVRAGEVLTSDMLRTRKPARGLSARFFFDVVGRRAARDIPAGTFLTESDVEGLS